MRYINDIKINDIERLEQENYDLLYENYIKQALEDGFFHADPYLDNIYKDDELIFVDFGMMGRLTDKNKMSLKNI